MTTGVAVRGNLIRLKNVVTLSHSSISMYLECPQKWKLKYIDKLPEKPRHFFSFGKSVHAALEYFYAVDALPPPSFEKVIRFYEDNWISEGYSGRLQEDEYKVEGRRILDEYYRKHIGSFQLPYFTEYAFQLEVDGVPVRGFVDRIDKVGEDRIAIIDYKTGKAIPAARAERDAQLTMYQMACERLLGKKVESLTLYHLPSQTARRVPAHGPELVDALRRQIVAVAEKIEAESFDPKPEERKCSWCDFKPFCPIFKDAYSPRGASAIEASVAAPVLRGDAELARRVDRYGKITDEMEALGRELAELRQAISEDLKRQGYSRVFGEEYELVCSTEKRWDFADRKKVLDAIQGAGFWDRIVAPSATLVQKLMSDPNLPIELRERLRRLGECVERAELQVKKVDCATAREVSR